MTICHVQYLAESRTIKQTNPWAHWLPKCFTTWTQAVLADTMATILAKSQFCHKICFLFKRFVFVSYNCEEQFQMGETSRMGRGSWRHTRNKPLHASASVCVCTSPKCSASPNWTEWSRNCQRLDKAKFTIWITLLKNEKLSWDKFYSDHVCGWY